jgi:hypothetical protein
LEVVQAVIPVPTFELAGIFVLQSQVFSRVSHVPTTANKPNALDWAWEVQLAVNTEFVPVFLANSNCGVATGQTGTHPASP